MKHGTTRKTSRQLAKETVDKFRSIHLRTGVTDAPGLEAIGVVVVEHDNLSIHPESFRYTTLHKPTTIAPTPPNPAVGDPLHYESMIQRICNAYSLRFP